MVVLLAEAEVVVLVMAEAAGEERAVRTQRQTKSCIERVGVVTATVYPSRGWVWSLHSIPIERVGVVTATVYRYLRDPFDVQCVS